MCRFVATLPAVAELADRFPFIARASLLQVESPHRSSKHRKLDVDSIWNRQLRHLLEGGVDDAGRMAGHHPLVNVSSDDHIGAVSFQAIPTQPIDRVGRAANHNNNNSPHGSFDTDLLHAISIPASPMSPLAAQVRAADMMRQQQQQQQQDQHLTSPPPRQVHSFQYLCVALPHQPSQSENKLLPASFVRVFLLRSLVRLSSSAPDARGGGLAARLSGAGNVSLATAAKYLGRRSVQAKKTAVGRRSYRLITYLLTRTLERILPTWVLLLFLFVVDGDDYYHHIDDRV